MSKPDEVRCGNCVFWETEEEEGFEGGFVSISRCHLSPKARRKGPNDFCGEFRKDWPNPARVSIVWDEEAQAWAWWATELPKEPDLPKFGISGGCICGKCDSCRERGVPAPGERT